eukprot:m.275877 g.275877  ORF g.275877 m.275877 type:complete len:666 (+) comp26912_c0_seq2:438-2435(+)
MLSEQVTVVPETPTQLDAKHVYDWQRPTETYKDSLLARQDVLRDLDLDTNDDFLAEWFALLSEVDRLVREEHSLEDNLQIRSCQYYKQVLLARQAELREVDLQSNPTLLIEWYTLIKELDYVVRRQTFFERKGAPQTVDVLLREGKVRVAQQFNVPGGGNYAASSRSRTVKKASSTPDEETTAPSSGGTRLRIDSSYAASAHTQAERFRALVQSPTQAEAEAEESPRWTEPADDVKRKSWTPETVERIHTSTLPRWLLDDVEFINGLAEGMPSCDGPATAMDLQRMTEVDLNRQIAETDEEIRLTRTKLELDTSMDNLRQERKGLHRIVDSEQRAHLVLELDDRLMALECKEQEAVADELMQDIRDLDEELGKARLRMLQHPRIGEIVDRAAVMDGLAHACPGVDVSTMQTQLAKAAAGPLALRHGSGQLGVIPSVAVQDAQDQSACDAAAASDVNRNLLALRKSALAKAKHDLNGRPGRHGPVSHDWETHQLAKIRVDASSRQEMRDTVAAALGHAAESRGGRIAAYTELAEPGSRRQALLVEQQAVLAVKQLEAEAVRRSINEAQGFAITAAAHVGHRHSEKARWECKIRGLREHVEQSIEKIEEMNQAMEMITGTSVLALNGTYGVLSEQGGRVRRGYYLSSSAAAPVPSAHTDAGDDQDWL